MKHFALAVLAGVTAFSISAPAQAAVCASAGGVVSTSLVACSGYVAKNHLSNSPADQTIQTSALTNLGLAVTPNYAALMAGGSLSKVSTLGAGNMLSFPITSELFGETYIGIHWGGPGGGQTAFYKFNFTEVVSSIEILGSNPKGFSAAVLYSTQIAPPPQPLPAVPEPATWALMIGGFVLAGSMMRRRDVKVSFA